MFRKWLDSLEILMKVAVIAAVLLWLGDWAVFRLRASRGIAFHTIQVQEYLATPLKGDKEEYDYMGPVQENCVRTLFPHANVPPCWWLRRHTTRWE